MLNSTTKQSLFCFFLGLAVTFVATLTLGLTTAIAAPNALFEGFRSLGALETGLFLWDLVVVFGLGAGLMAFLALLAAFRLWVSPTMQPALAFLGGSLATAHAFAPLAYGMPLLTLLSRPWWGYGLELSLIVATLAALFVARRLGPNNSFKPKPLRSGKGMA